MGGETPSPPEPRSPAPIHDRSGPPNLFMAVNPSCQTARLPNTLTGQPASHGLSSSTSGRQEVPYYSHATTSFNTHIVKKDSRAPLDGLPGPKAKQKRKD